MTHGEKLQGVILGTAIGDAVGLPAEGLSRRKLQELGWTDHWQHRLIGHFGMFSDDTEHTWWLKTIANSF